MSAATRRINKEYSELQADYPPNAYAIPDENNLFHWTGYLIGPPTSDYKGGRFNIDVSSRLAVSQRIRR